MKSFYTINFISADNAEFDNGTPHPHGFESYDQAYGYAINIAADGFEIPTDHVLAVEIDTMEYHGFSRHIVFSHNSNSIEVLIHRIDIVGS